jgi:type I restriction enzyme, S subunit
MTDGGIDAIGHLPDSWSIVRLGHIATSKGGFGFPIYRQGEKKGEFPFFKVSDMNLPGNEKFMRSSNNWIDSLTLKALKAKTFPRSAILFPKIGAALLTNKKRMLVRDSVIDNNVMAVVVNDESVCVPEYLYHWFLTLDLGRIANAGTVPSLTSSRLAEVSLPLPPAAEQRKIAAVLGLVQRAIEQQERLIALTTELKKTLLNKLFTEGLHSEPQKQTEIGAVPESWEQRPLENAGEVVYGIQAAVASNLKPIGTMILTNKNITLDGKIVLEKINYFVLKTKRHHETVLKKGDLLFNWRSGSKEHVGKTAYFDLAGDFVHSSFILRIRPSDEVTGRYLFYYLNFLRESGFFLKKQTFSVNAKFNKSAINELPTYLPDDNERRDIVGALDAVGKKLDALHAKKQLFEDLFRTLLHQLITAQIRLGDLDLTGISNTTLKATGVSEDGFPRPSAF